MIRAYSVKDVIKAFRNPDLARKEIDRIGDSFLHAPRRIAFSHNHEYDSDVMGEDWDNLIILDACRYDILLDIDRFDDVGYRILDSSNSKEFIENYISGSTYTGTVYVTANPHSARIEPSTFFRKIATFSEETSTGTVKADVQNLDQSWAPEVVYRTVVDAFEQHPNKRMVTHFMQPHGPYFGERAEEIRSELQSQGYRFWAWDDDLGKEAQTDSEYILAHLLRAAQQGVIDRNEMVEIYKENIEYVLQYVDRLLDELNGKTVITADHGEMLGESKSFLPSDMGGMRRSIGHGYGIHVKELRKVPWVVPEYTERREIVDEEYTGHTHDGTDNVQSQLRALGYK